MIALRARGLSVRYGQLEAVRRVDFEVPRSQVVGIVGPNLSGKSSLMAALAGIEPAFRGCIEVSAEGGRLEEVTRTSPEERLRRHRIYLAPEASGVFPSLTVEENLLLTPRLLRLDSVRADLESVYSAFPLLAERRRVAARFLSGGWRQILAVCRAQMVHPRVLLCDEPCLGLSPPMAKLVLETLTRTSDPLGRRSSLLLTEQSTDRLVGVADLLMTLDRGCLSVPGKRENDPRRDP